MKRNLKEIYSANVTDNLKEVLKTDELAGLKISGFVSTPDFTRSSKKDYHIYINSRTVKCPIFQKAIDTAYKNLIAGGRYPFVVLNLEIPPADIDINVHPTKKEVRYKNPNQIFNFIIAGILGGLSNSKESAPQNSPVPQTIPSVSENIIEFQPRENTLDVFYDKSKDEMSVSDEALIYTPTNTYNAKSSTEQIQFFETEEPAPEPEDIIIGQYKNTYILIELEDGLEIVDQHIAEERYYYEKLRAEKQVTSQMLFISDVLEVSATEAELIKENLDKFEKFGFGIEFTSENELVFRKVPQMISKVTPKEILSDILENIEGDIDNLEENILKTTACKASVKAGQKLSMWQMQEIIKKWRTTELPYTCPHGRPINKIIPHKELAGWFQRNA